MKEQTNGERFEEFMRTVEGYPELEGTMNLCEDIIEKKTGKMTEEEWQAAERAQTEPKDVVLGYKTSLDAQMLDSQLPKQERTYSEEEVLELLLKSKIETSNLYYEDMKEWFEQFKKK